MRYQVELPDDVERLLTERATETGEDVVTLIRVAVVRFVESDAGAETRRRRPHPPLDTVEISAPYDFPRSSPQPIAIEVTQRRRPDPLPDIE